MRKYILIICTIFMAISASAQKFAFVDSEYILNHLPEYKSALSQLEGNSKQWQAQADERFFEIDKLYKSYQADQVLLTEEMRKKRENEIIEKEKAAKDFQRQKFGPDGDLFQLRTKLLKPIQGKVSDAITAIAKMKFIDFIFDKGSDATMMIYASNNYDLSNEVIIKLGYKPNTPIN